MIFVRRHFGHFLLNYLFHSRCLLCEKPLHDMSPLCPECFEELKFGTEKRCVKCGQVMSSSLVDPSCADCRNRHYPYHEIRILGTYAGSLQKLVQGLKFRERHSVSAVLADCLVRFVDPSYFLVDCMVPVPLHRSRLKERGYNQSRLVLDRIGRYLRVPVLADALVRHKNTKPQSRLRAEERRENVRDAFRPGRQAKLMSGKKILLFDDVMTTGNTLNEACETLKKCGPSSVKILAIARAE